MAVGRRGLHGGRASTQRRVPHQTTVYAAAGHVIARSRVMADNPVTAETSKLPTALVSNNSPKELK